MTDIIPPPFANSSFIYTRSGSCNRCGICCVDDKCPHITKKGNKWICLIYATRSQECESCKILLGKVGISYTHKVCEYFPNHPFLNCLQGEYCGYIFIPVPVENP